ncbi:MAG: ABC transporter substrate-binding protein [Geopsychrobacter sp.]|nr:ABC transporter substrate-binding protein [Geopsychrobacter sp.]
MMFRYLLLLTVFLFLAEPAFARRIVVLAPAAGDILLKLGLEEQVVGKTRSLEEFPKAKKVGSHIKPNVELIKGLEPDLLIISSNRFFSEQMSAAVDAQTFTYNPKSLAEILQQTEALGHLTGRTAAAEELTHQLRKKLHGLKPLDQKTRVIYEISALPLSVAGQKNIISDIVRAAGGTPVDFGTRKIIKIGSEAIIASQPDLYIYQTGPMNRTPTPPRERNNYRLLHCNYLKVDQLLWSRANSNSFDRVLELNRILRNR